MTLSAVVLPQRFSGESNARIGEHWNASRAWACRTHNATASGPCSGHDQMMPQLSDDGIQQRGAVHGLLPWGRLDQVDLWLRPG